MPFRMSAFRPSAKPQLPFLGSHILKRRAPPSRRRGASPAARSSMNARGGGLFHVTREYLTKCVEGFPKPGEANSKLLSSANRDYSMVYGRIQIARLASRFSLRLAPQRPAPARVDVRRRAAATRRHKDGAAPAWREPSRNPCPPRFRPRSRPFLETKSNDSTDLENRKQKSCRTMRLSTITHG